VSSWEWNDFLEGIQGSPRPYHHGNGRGIPASGEARGASDSPGLPANEEAVVGGCRVSI